MFPIILNLGPLTLHSYGLMVALGFLTGIYFLRKQFDRYGLDNNLVDNLVLTIILSGLFGARLLYFLIEAPDVLRRNPVMFFKIWEGGLVYYGSFIFALGAVVCFARLKKIRIWTLLDALAAPLFIAHALGRIGCFAAGCCYGRGSDSIFSVTFTHAASLAPLNEPLLPTQLFSSLGNALLFLIALKLSKKDRFPGFLFSFYLVSYGAFRFGMEFLRGDFRGEVLFGLQPSQWIALTAIVVGLGLWGKLRKA